ncbi:MAG: CBS domain-containing protein [Anaerolineae bacterium]|nr:CBS domain-containing protein [Anaerolineae bacterium]
MNVADIMTANPVTICQDRTLRDALGVMESSGCHHIPVTGSDGHVIGIISDRDCRIALNSPATPPEDWRNNNTAQNILVRRVMTPAPIVVEPDASADEAARLMLSHHISSLPVMRSETLIGIITTSDILSAFIRLSKNIPEEVEDISR